MFNCSLIIFKEQLKVFNTVLFAALNCKKQRKFLKDGKLFANEAVLWDDTLSCLINFVFC